jgi:hypothetical protein
LESFDYRERVFPQRDTPCVERLCHQRRFTRKEHMCSGVKQLPQIIALFATTVARIERSHVRRSGRTFSRRDEIVKKVLAVWKEMRTAVSDFVFGEHCS